VEESCPNSLSQNIFGLVVGEREIDCIQNDFLEITILQPKRLLHFIENTGKLMDMVDE